MKKTSFLTSLVAVCVACSANAASDVTFAGNYHLNETTELNVTDPLPGTTYDYTASDGAHNNIAYDTEPDATLFTYTGTDGVADGSNLSTDAPAQSDFTGESAANGTTVFTTQTIASGETVDPSNYSYVSGNGGTVSLGASAIPMTETVALDSTYTNGHTIDVTNGETPTDFDATLYSGTIESTGRTYHLNPDGSALQNDYNETINTGDDPELNALLTAMQTAYTTDSAALETAVSTTGTQWATEQENFAAAQTAVNTDMATVETLNHNYGTLTEALDLYQAAQAAQATAGEAQAADVATQNAALAVYNAPIEETITNGANDAIDASIESGSIKTALDGKADASDVAANTSAIETNAGNIATNTADIATNTANIATNTADIATNTSAIETNAGNIATNTADIATNTANIATNTADIATNTSAIADNAAKIETNTANIAANTGAISAETERATGAENALQTQLNNAIADARAADIDTLKSANAYTDKMIGDLDQDLSSGVAGAVALSSVAVSNVKRGEVSVGGGYGYYNNQSAFALGAAMGLTDNWSINAGAGLGINGGNLSVRAGTNYKFKLF